MTTLIAFHEVNDGQTWANAWRQGPGSRHEMFGKIGVKARTFRDPNSHEATGVLMEVPDMELFNSFMASEEVKLAMEEDGLKVETVRILSEFTP
jgi:hypothetical protein